MTAEGIIHIASSSWRAYLSSKLGITSIYSHHYILKPTKRTFPGSFFLRIEKYHFFFSPSRSSFEWSTDLIPVGNFSCCCFSSVAERLIAESFLIFKTASIFTRRGALISSPLLTIHLASVITMISFLLYNGL